ncbi:hypothetical protein HDV00_011301 [Rhizophlyctis rosea]|nr:hypothetical protein HDV00_011301 [Rhizophlyctis rosea]
MMDTIHITSPALREVKREDEDIMMTEVKTPVKFLLPAPADNAGRKKRGRDFTDEERAIKKAVREQKNREAASRSRQLRKNQQNQLETINATLLQEGDQLRKRLCTQEDVNKRLIERLDALTKEIDTLKNAMSGAGTPADILPPPYAPPTPISAHSSSPILIDDDTDTSPSTFFTSTPSSIQSPFTPAESNNTLADYFATLLGPTTSATTDTPPPFTDFTLLTDTDPILPTTPSTTSLDDILFTILTTPTTPTTPTLPARTTHKNQKASHAEPAAFDTQSLPRTRLASSSPPHPSSSPNHPTTTLTHQLQMQTMVLLAVVMMTARMREGAEFDGGVSLSSSPEDGGDPLRVVEDETWDWRAFIVAPEEGGDDGERKGGLEWGDCDLTQFAESVLES